MNNNKVGIFLYNRLFDPLIQSNFWLYIRDYLESNKGKEKTVYLITYENKLFPLTQEQERLLADWKSLGLVWIPLSWSPGIGIFPKSKDICIGFLAVLKLKLKGCNHFISLASVAGSFLYLYHFLLRFNYFLYQFEPHSEYAIDNNMWKINSLQYKISHIWKEKLLIMQG